MVSVMASLLHSLVLPAGLVVILGGCGEKQRRVKDTGEPPGCAEGYLADRGACVPASCGTGTWGDLEVDASSVYVDIEAAEGGDGSEGAPLRSIQPALDLAGSRGGGRVAVAAGTYAETLEITRAHEGVHLAGRCRELVSLDASVGEAMTPGIYVSSGFAMVTVTGLDVIGAQGVGIEVGSGVVQLMGLGVMEGLDWGVFLYAADLGVPTSLEMEDCELAGNVEVGVGARESTTSVELRNTRIQGTLPNAQGGGGYGIYAYASAALTAEDCELVGNTTSGVVATDSGTTVALVDTKVRDTVPSENSHGGVGIVVKDSAAFTAEGCDLIGNATHGVFAFGSATTVALVDTIVQDTVPDKNRERGEGIVVQGSAALTAKGCDLVGNTSQGVFAFEPGTTVALVDTMIQDTLPDGSGHFGDGIYVGEGAALTAEGCDLVGNTELGVFAVDLGTTVALVDTRIRDTLPAGNGDFGCGVQLQSGAALSLEGCELAGNSSAGIVAWDSGTRVAIRDSCIVGTFAGYSEKGAAAVALNAQDGASITASGLLAEANEGPGLVSWGENSTLACTGCSLLGNEFAGAVAKDKGDLEFHSSIISGTVAGANLGGGVGIFNEGPSSLLVTDSTISDNLVAGVWINGEGSYQLSGNDVEGSISVPHGATSRCGDGVFAAGTKVWDGSSGLLMEGNTLSDNTGAGLFLDDAAVLLDGNSWSDNAPDLMVQGEACLAPPEDWAEAPTSEICPTWDRPTCELALSFSLAVVDIAPAMPPPPSGPQAPLPWLPEPRRASAARIASDEGRRRALGRR